jgi:hypothetical protein
VRILLSLFLTIYLFPYYRWKTVMFCFLLLIIWPNWSFFWIIVGNF